MTTVVDSVDVALRDGSTVHMRPVRAGDAECLHELLAGLSTDSRWLRFIGSGGDLRRHAERFAAPDGFGIVATAGEPGRIVAHAEYRREGDGQAEVAFEVADDHQGLGIGTILLAHLVEAAEREGVRTFTALVDPANHRMAQVFRDSGFPVDVSARPGELHFEMPASLDPGARRRFEDRDRLAAVAAVAHVLRPASVAVVGASRRARTVGGAVLANLRAGGYAGPLHVVHPQAREVGGIPALPALPAGVELAVVAVPAEAVIGVARDCAAARVPAMVVLSAGFAEAGEDGARRQAELLEACRAAGIRLLGPNCLGVLNTEPAVRLDATFAPDAPPAGRIAFASHSGAFGIAAIEQAAERGLGLSSFVSMGNSADLSGNDFLRYWQQDSGTDVVLLYLESFGNPRRFGRIAREVSAAKPVVAVKSGRSAAGARAASSHTGALLAVSDVTVDALFRHAGVIRTDTVGEQLDVAALLAGQPLPRGDRVAIVTNAGGPGIACADACAAVGLRVEPLAQPLRRRLRERLSPHAAVANPVDVIASAPAGDFQGTIELLAAEPDVDAIVSIFIPPLVTRSDDVAAAVSAAAQRTARAGTPLLAVFMAEPEAHRRELAAAAGVPVYATPEEAARALGHVTRYAAWRRRGADPAPALSGLDPDAVAAILARALEREDEWLTPPDVEAVLRGYGIPLAASRLAATPAEAGRHAAELGGAVAVKAVASGLVHKSDAGGVVLGIRGADAARRAASGVGEAVAKATGRAPEGFLVQAMAPEGSELIVGIVSDPDFGPVIACGAGGRAVELLGDVAVRLAPVGPRTAADMLRSLRTFPLLEGYRGAPPADVPAVEDVILRVSALAAAHPEIAELDCNPVRVGPDGAVVLDARVRVTAPPPPRPFPALDP